MTKVDNKLPFSKLNPNYALGFVMRENIAK
jgi:hypothetical protein